MWGVRCAGLSVLLFLLVGLCRQLWPDALGRNSGFEDSLVDLSVRIAKPEYVIVEDCNVKQHSGVNCQQACADRGFTCDRALMRALTTQENVSRAFRRAGVKCKSINEENIEGLWDGPHVDPGGSCTFNGNAHARKRFPPECLQAPVCSYRRLCICSQTGKERPAANRYTKYMARLPEGLPPGARPPPALKKGGKEPPSSTEYRSRMSQTDVQGEPYKTPNQVLVFWDTHGDRSAMRAFYAKVGQWGVRHWTSGFNVLNIGARFYNQQMKEMFFDRTMRLDGRYKYFALDPNPQAVATLGTDGVFSCLAQDAPTVYPDYADFVHLVVDIGVLGWGPVFDLVNADADGVENYIKGIHFLLKPGGLYIFVTSCDAFCRNEPRDPSKAKVFRQKFDPVDNFLGFAHGQKTDFNSQVFLFRKKQVATAEENPRRSSDATSTMEHVPTQSAMSIGSTSGAVIPWDGSEFVVVEDCVDPSQAANCIEACADRGSTCNNNMMKVLTNRATVSEAFQRAGIECIDIQTEDIAGGLWDGPLVEPGGTCRYNKNLLGAREFPPECNLRPVCGWKRLCACVQTGTEGMAANVFTRYLVNSFDVVAPIKQPDALEKREEPGLSKQYRQRMRQTDVQGEPYKTPAQVRDFWNSQGDRAAMRAFYARLGAWGVENWRSGFNAMNVGARFYNQRTKEMYFNRTTRDDHRYKFYQLDPNPNRVAEQGTDGTFSCMAQDLAVVYPAYAEHMHTVVDIGVLGWGPVFDLVNADPRGVEKYIEGIWFLLRPGGLYIFLTSCDAFCKPKVDNRDPSHAKILRERFDTVPRFLGFKHGELTNFNSQVFIFRKKMHA